MRRSILLTTTLVAAFALAACGGGGSNTSTATPGPTATPATVNVPDVVGDPEADALVTLGADGLKAGDKVSAYDGKVAKGTIISTNPKAGVVVQRGTAIDYRVSRGPAPTPSPSPKPASPARKPAAPAAKPAAAAVGAAKPKFADEGLARRGGTDEDVGDVLGFFERFAHVGERRHVVDDVGDCGVDSFAPTQGLVHVGFKGKCLPEDIDCSGLIPC